MRTFFRQVNEGLVIGNNIQVTVLEIQDDHVHLAFSSDDDNGYWEEKLFFENSEATAELQLQ